MHDSVVDNEEFVSILDLMKEWGSCHIEVYPWVVAKIIVKQHEDNPSIIIDKVSLSGPLNNQTVYYCHIFSSKLPKGYHGTMDYIIKENNDYQLKKWNDT